MPDWGLVGLGAVLVLIGGLIGGRGKGKGGQSGFHVMAKSFFGPTTQVVTFGNINTSSPPSPEQKESRDVVGWTLGVIGILVGLIGVAVSVYGLFLTLPKG